MPDPAPSADVLRELQPVTDAPDVQPSERLGLCLSGGGYRAMLFHLGALWRLNETGLLKDIERISSVSGGSITAATVGLHWGRLDWRDGVASNLEDLVVVPVRALARESIDASSVIEGLLPFTSVGRRVAHAYREHLFGDATLQALPDDRKAGQPRFVICATNLESGVLFRFSRPYAADYRVGTIRDPEIPLADAVAASSAFPPVLSPFEIDLRRARWETVAGNELVAPEWRAEIKLSDGGVYDNLGLETVWKRCASVLISDGGGQTPDEADPPADWPRQSIRVLKVVDSQVRALRKRQAIGSYKLGLRGGTYWGVRSHVADYQLPDALEAPEHLTRRLAETPTRLKSLDDAHQERLVNWGYLICDTALRKWVEPPGAERPERLPYPASALG
jgi:NTE family protein